MKKSNSFRWRKDDTKRKARLNRVEEAMNLKIELKIWENKHKKGDPLAISEIARIKLMQNEGKLAGLKGKEKRLRKRLSK